MEAEQDLILLARRGLRENEGEKILASADSRMKQDILDATEKRFALLYT